MPQTNEAFSRVKIDAQLKDQGWEIQNSNAVRFEYVLPDGTKADYVLGDRKGRSMAPMTHTLRAKMVASIQRGRSPHNMDIERCH